VDFDFVIVGAGSAGCVLANRLSEDPGNSVLLLESGPADRNPLIRMPRGMGKLLNPANPEIATYEVSRGGNRPSEFWMKGRTLGGSSSVNGMVYVRGHPADYDGWAAAGCDGWSWAEVGRIFAAMEDHELGAAEDRGVDGPLRISVHPPMPGLPAAILAAAAEIGTPTVEDVNAAHDGGFGWQPRTIWRGHRQSAAAAFLAPAMKRPNLTVMTGVDVERIRFEGRRAAAVTVRGAGLSEITARREIILSAGAVESPKLLQLSGVGDGALLRSMGIDMVAEAPDVGQNLREHLYLPVEYRVASGSLNRQFAGPRLALNALRYLALRSGPLTHAAHELCGFVKACPGATRPDVQIGVGLYTMAVTEKGVAIDPEPGISIGAYFLRPQSKGELRIVSPDPKAAPFIDANYLAHEEDRAGTVAMVRYIRRLAAQPVLAPYALRETSPGPGYQTDDEIAQAAVELGGRAFHVAGTCRMGADARSVVDSRLRVRGVEGLRVADTSIMPELVSGNTNAPAMMIGQRAADFILAGD
jgi:choline dehydrogenase-like flavoprotein